jgi:hypothetical protein
MMNTHTLCRFVSALLLVDDSTLISAGGDGEAYVWDLKTLRLKRQLDVSAIGRFSKVKSQREKWLSKEEFAKRKKGKDKEGGERGEAGEEKEAVDDTEEAKGSNGAGDDDDDNNEIVAIRKIALAGRKGGDRLLVFSSSG